MDALDISALSQIKLRRIDIMKCITLNLIENKYQ